MVDMVDMASATATMASVMLSPRLMLIPTTMVDMVLDMASAMEGTMVDMVDMASATATMASVMLSPRLMLIPTTMVDMVLDMASAMEGTMVDLGYGLGYSYYGKRDAEPKADADPYYYG